MKKLGIALASVSVVGGVVLTGTAGADGLNGRSVCSGSSAPDAVVDPTDPGTWNNAGEIVGSSDRNGP